jgi:hypothetical protein
MADMERHSSFDTPLSLDDLMTCALSLFARKS